MSWITGISCTVLGLSSLMIWVIWKILDASINWHFPLFCSELTDVWLLLHPPRVVNLPVWRSITRYSPIHHKSARLFFWSQMRRSLVRSVIHPVSLISLRFFTLRKCDSLWIVFTVRKCGFLWTSISIVCESFDWLLLVWSMRRELQLWTQWTKLRKFRFIIEQFFFEKINLLCSTENVATAGSQSFSSSGSLPCRWFAFVLSAFVACYTGLFFFSNFARACVQG